MSLFEGALSGPPKPRGDAARTFLTSKWLPSLEVDPPLAFWPLLLLLLLAPLPAQLRLRLTAPTGDDAAGCGGGKNDPAGITGLKLTERERWW